MAGDEASGTRRRRRRRAVWRPGEGISRTVDAASGEPGVELGDVEAAGFAATAGIADIEDGNSGTEAAANDPFAESAEPVKPTAPAEPAQPSEPLEAGTPAAKRAVKRPRADPAERGLRELVGAGPSQLGPVRAMRARDANRPTEEDLAEAERNLTIVRRNWKPPADS